MLKISLICPHLIEFYKKMVFKKGRKEWGFENEIRYIFDVTESWRRQILYDVGKLEFLTIPFDALKRVDFGCDVNMKNCVNDVRRLANGSRNQVEFRKMIERSGKSPMYEPL